MAKSETRVLTDGQRAYEAKRAAKAGVSLEKWLAMKARDEAAARKVVVVSKPVKKPGLLGRLIDRAHKPLK